MQFKPLDRQERALAELISQVFPSMSILRRNAFVQHYYATKHVHTEHHHAGTEYITCLVASHIRHTETDYDSRFPTGYYAPELKRSARQAVQPLVSQKLNE